MTTAQMVSLWRELTGEFFTDPVPDATVYIYLNRALEALNDRIGWHITTDTTSVTLVAGTQEYTLPTTVVEMIWIHWDTRFLDKGDTNEWDMANAQWRSEDAGELLAFAHEGNRLIFRPTPSAAAVTRQAVPTLRFVSTPATVESDAAGPPQLATQHRRLPVYYAVSLWSETHPDSPLAVHRGEKLGERFEQEAALAAAYYRRRRLGQKGGA